MNFVKATTLFVSTILSLTLSMIFLTGNTFANPISSANEITIYDGNYSSASAWYGQSENNEVEPGMVTSQSWDLEGFFLEYTNLYMVGGYDFKNGNQGFTSGDIFIDIDGDAEYGDIHGTQNGQRDMTDTYGYDYVIDLDFSSLTYTVLGLDSDTVLRTAYYSANQGSSPWQYVSNGNVMTTGQITYEESSSDAADFFNDSDLHNMVAVDLSFLLGVDADTITYHFTMGCGNDNLMGQSGEILSSGSGSHAPEPGTILLLGFGMLSFAGLTRANANKG